MNADVDPAVLNSVNVKRFTRSVLEANGAAIDRSDRAKWAVTFPDRLAERLDRESGALVFDPADREPGSGDLLVQPGTQVFSALLDLVDRSGSFGRLELGADDLQVDPPAALGESHVDVELAGFSERTWETALSFHFRVGFETPASFHSEEMVTVTVDPETGARLPALTDRLTAHLPQLLERGSAGTADELPTDAIRRSHADAQEAVVEQCRPIVEELRERAEASATQRIDELADWYEQRRDELDRAVRDQREEILKWQEKRRRARNERTRQRYVENREDAEAEYDRLAERVERRKEELDAEEAAAVEDVLERNAVDVDVSLLGVTEVRYVRGTVTIELRTEFAEAAIEAEYLPATDQYHGLDCAVCSADLTEGVRPRLCVEGHLVGEPCSTSCRSCGRAHCTDCTSESTYRACAVCWEDVCADCRATCADCGRVVCPDHAEECSSCGESTCHLCGEACSTCGAFHCDEHLRRCPACDALHCPTHVEACVDCATTLCAEHGGTCADCGDPVCSEHGHRCDDCGETICGRHVERCGVCSAERDEDQHGYCSTHVVRCAVGGTVVCADHREPTTIGDAFVCPDHHGRCATCRVGYRTTELTDGQCAACRSIGAVAEETIPAALREEFPSVSAGENEAYLVVLGTRRFRRNVVVVYDRESATEHRRHAAGLLNQLRGRYR